MREPGARCSYLRKKQIVRKTTVLFAAALGLLTLAGCSDKSVGNVSLGIFTFKDVDIQAFQDPVVTGVTCHVASINSPLQLTDPSESAVACHQSGEITAEMIAKIDKSKDGDVVFKESKSVFLKDLKIRRIYDAKNQTLIYLSYTTREINGNYQHAISTVPLWGTRAWQKGITP